MDIAVAIADIGKRISGIQKELKNKPSMLRGVIAKVNNTQPQTVDVQTPEGNVIQNITVVGDWAARAGRSVWITSFDRRKYLALGQENEPIQIVSDGWPNNWPTTWPEETAA